MKNYKNEERKELKDVKIYKSKNGSYCLRLEYNCEDESKRYKIILPKVELPLCQYTLPIVNVDNIPTTKVNLDTYLELYGNQKLMICPDEKGNLYYEEIIEEKVQDLTIEEIQKRLGYKIRIVESKEDA